MKTDYQKDKIEKNAITRNIREFDTDTNNIYETVAILSKRANQISTELKDEMRTKMQEFNTSTDTLDEIFENRDQIELAKTYEQMPKPALLAIHEFENKEIYYREGEEPKEDKE